MKKLLAFILLSAIFLSPLFLLIGKSVAEIEPVEISLKDYETGLEDVPYFRPPIEYVKIQELAIAIEQDTDSHSEETSEIQETKWEYYDIVKEDDVIQNPYFYKTSYKLSKSDRDLIERTVMHEAGWCPDYRLLVLTAQCFRNACELNNWTPEETYSKCGYAAMSYANPRAEKAVSDVFDNRIKCVDETIFCYYNRNMVYSADHERHNLAIDIDGNRFFY